MAFKFKALPLSKLERVNLDQYEFFKYFTKSANSNGIESDLLYEDEYLAFVERYPSRSDNYKLLRWKFDANDINLLNTMLERVMCEQVSITREETIIDFKEAVQEMEL